MRTMMRSVFPYLALTLFCAGCTHGETSRYCESVKPTGVGRVAPIEDAIVDISGIVVGANIRSTEGPQAVNATSIELMLDGINVTPQARVTVAQETTSQTSDISFIPLQPLLPGKHVVQLRFADATNARSCYRWVFHAREIQ